MSIDSAGTVPVRAISSPLATKVASMSLKLVRKVETTMCLTANDAVECSLSRAQVPSSVEGAVALMWGFSLLRLVYRLLTQQSSSIVAHTTVYPEARLL